MTESEFVEFVLTCASWQEAQAIADALLEKRLVACVEFMEVKSKFHWQGRLEESAEIKLIMVSMAAKFDEVEAEVAAFHSYDIFVLQQLPITRISAQAAKWLQESLQ